MRRDDKADSIVFVLLCFLLFLVLVSCVSVLFWLQSLRATQLRDQADQFERRAKAEAARMKRTADESGQPMQDEALP